MKIPNPTQRLNFTYVDDIVDAYMLAIEKMINFQNPYETINIAHPIAISLSDMISNLEKIADKKLQIEY